VNTTEKNLERRKQEIAELEAKENEEEPLSLSEQWRQVKDQCRNMPRRVQIVFTLSCLFALTCAGICIIHIWEEVRKKPFFFVRPDDLQYAAITIALLYAILMAVIAFVHSKQEE
jgi:hypothetical protein